MSNIEIARIEKETYKDKKIYYHYNTDSYYEVITSLENHLEWIIQMKLVRFPSMMTKSFESQLFEPYVENPTAFKCMHDGVNVGYMQLGFDSWNNRLRIWELVLEKNYRRCGIGSKLMAKAKEHACELGARMIVLETQSCNVPAINFYLKQGFQLIGFDLASYSNNDQEKNEVRLELGLVVNNI